MTEREHNICPDTVGENADQASAIEAWCHACEKDVTAFYNADLELECDVCKSTFVEKRGQTGLAEYVTSASVRQDAEEGAEFNDTGGGINNRSGTRPDGIPSISGGSTEQGSQEAPTTPTSTASLSAANGGEERSDSPSSTQSPTSSETSTRFSDEENAVIRRILNSSENPPMIRRRDASSGSGRINIRRADSRQPGAMPLNDTFNADAIIYSLLSVLSGAGDMQLGMQMSGNGGVPQDALGDILHHILMNENSTPGAPPASEETINSIKKVEVTNENIDELGGACYISQEPFEIGSTVLQLDCGHAFNHEDITKWLKMHNTCPVCRVPVNGGDDKDDKKEETFVSASEGVVRADGQSST